MAERPTAGWRRGVVEEAAEVAAGALEADCAYRGGLFPEGLLRETDAVLESFEDELRGLSPSDDARIFAVVERVVLALNLVNDAYDGCAFETDERERLCAYIDASLAERGIDVAALTARRGLGRYELTDQWRDW
ncbi:hypothetical protein [Streptomyces sp. NPDC004682]